MKILISTGDLSGELYGAELLKRLKDLRPESEFFSINQGILSEAGARAISTSGASRVVGVSEVLKECRNLVRTYGKVRRFFEKNPPQGVILIDYPEFNLNLIAPLAKKKKSRILYFIPPQVWAWREYRLKSLKRLIDHLVVILPFEKDYYNSKGITDVKYFGHPLVDRFFPPSPLSDDSIFSDKEGVIRVALMPGSRASELKHHIGLVNYVVRNLKQKYTNLSFLLPVAPGLEKEVLSIDESVTLVFDPPSKQSASEIVLRNADLALVASGTATLEAVLLDVPMIVFYRVSRLSAFIGKKCIKVPYISLPNLILNRAVVPEFVQYFYDDDILQGLDRLIQSHFRIGEGSLENAEEMSFSREGQIKAFDEVRALLGDPGVMDRIARWIAETFY